MNCLPKISIIIPTYNRAHTLDIAVRSALQQDYPNKEVIVVDDGSIDHTKQLVSKYSQVSYVYQENRGQAAARNAGLKLASGTFIATLDSDDEWYPDFLSKLYDAMENNQLDFVFANWLQQNKSDNYYNFLEKYFSINHPNLNILENNIFLFTYDQLRNVYVYGCPSPSSSLLIRRSSIVEFWNEEVCIADDWCLLLDVIMKEKCSVGFVNELLWIKRINQNNVYDNRANTEVTKLLYVHDLRLLIHRFRKQLAPAERKRMESKYITALLQCMLWNIRSKHTRVEAINYLREAFHISPGILTKIAFQMTQSFVLRKLMISQNYFSIHSIARN